MRQLSLSLKLKLFSRKILIALSLIIMPFIPATGILKLGFVVAERILYVPSIGFSLLTANGLCKIFKKFSNQKILIYAIFTIFITCHSLKTYHRSLEWTTEHRLFYSALKVVPRNAKVYYNIARISSETQSESKDIKTSVKFYKKAIQLYPNYESGKSTRALFIILNSKSWCNSRSIKSN